MRPTLTTNRKCLPLLLALLPGRPDSRLAAMFKSLIRWIALVLLWPVILLIVALSIWWLGEDDERP